ncbi:hypothetical protein LAT59_03300 [Candidatus Gracilibacteria bacterium]|nr:hypothetical protein [Candidatus Gracilibacteria bacterium]
MKIQLLIFFIVIGIIVFIVYPNDRGGIDEARERIEQRQNAGDEDHIRDEEVIESEDIREDEIEDISDTQDTSTSSDQDELPTASLQVSDISDINTPSFVEYGDAVQTSDTSFIYNQVRGLEVFIEQTAEELTCDDLTEFLTARLQSWYFWNTCRFISGERGLKFNVLRLSGEEYVYERHYIDNKSGLYGILELERGEGIDRDMLPEKNTEFRDREFPLIEVADSLLRELVRVN